MKAKQFLPYLAALLFLAWSLGTLARSGSNTGGLLINSYWLVYILYLIPVLAVGGLLVIVAILVLEWKVLSDAIGMGLAARHRKKAAKKGRTISFIVGAVAWLTAFGVLFWRCGGLQCRAVSVQNATQVVRQEVFNGTATQSLPFSGEIARLSGFLGPEWFVWPFLALIILGGVIIGRGLLVSMDETRRVELIVPRVQQEGQIAVQEAMRFLVQEDADPGTRIIACYQRMVHAAASLGAHIAPDLTARELEAGIREMFHLAGPGIGELTKLFEEARYSLHVMTEVDSKEAQQCLSDIARELKAAPVMDEEEARKLQSSRIET